MQKKCLDIGSPTGGFVDCLLQKGVKRVYALEISTGELSEKLKKDDRVINMEGTDVRSDWAIPKKAEVVSCDCTFLSLKDVLPKLKNKVSNDCIFIGLIKPPFEVKKPVGKMKVDYGYQDIIDNLFGYAEKLKWKRVGFCESPILGKVAKQIEFLMGLSLK